jgi:hypothetical protein
MMDTSSQNNALINDYERDQERLRRQRQQQKEEIRMAVEAHRQEQVQAYELTYNGFPSQKGVSGTEHFYAAYQEIKGMLEDSIPLNLGRAVFLTENAYLNNAMDYQKYQADINQRAQYCQWLMSKMRLDANDNLAQNMAIYSLMTDTLNIPRIGKEGKTLTLYPVRYNLDDFDSHQQFTSHFITTLMATNLGNCYSMPLLYLIVAEKLGAEAYLCESPRHSFVKIKDDKGTWYNLEITSRVILSDYHYMNAGQISAEAVRNRIYMEPMGKKEAVANMLVQLGGYYLMRFGYDPFVLECAKEAEQYNPYSIQPKLLEEHYRARLAMEIARRLHEPTPQSLKEHYPDAYKRYEEALTITKRINDSGYKDQSKESYERWLKRIEKLKSEERLHPQPKVLKEIK